MVAGAGHMLPYEQPEQVELLIDAFHKAAKIG